MKAIRILGVTFADVSYEEAAGRLRGMLAGASAHQVVLANAHTLNLACDDPEYRRRLQRASLVLRDGIGLKLASIWGGQTVGYNFVGTDFVPRVLHDLPPGSTVFLFGARPGVAERAARRLSESCPRIRIAGTQDGYAAALDTEVLHRINTLAPDVLLVALGNPDQETWIADNLGALKVKVAIGVGALFDYLAGEVQRAPGWMRQIGAEWVFRLLVEPRRLWRRYLVGNVKFIARVALERPVVVRHTAGVKQPSSGL